jgi:hypothetical protein
LIIGSTRYVTNGEPLFGGYFVGQLDEIRVSRVARYKGEEFTPGGASIQMPTPSPCTTATRANGSG